MSRISRAFTLSYSHNDKDACAHCEIDLFEGDVVAFVDDAITCEDCVTAIIAKDPLYQLALKKQRERKK